MATLQSQYRQYLKDNPKSILTYDQWLDQVWKVKYFGKRYENLYNRWYWRLYRWVKWKAKYAPQEFINPELHHRMRSKQIDKQILRLKLGSLKIKFVFRHRFEKYRTLSDKAEWRNWELGIWFRKSRLVGTMKKGKGAFSRNNLVPEYMVGLNLLAIKLWVTVSRFSLEFHG